MSRTGRTPSTENLRLADAAFLQQLIDAFPALSFVMDDDVSVVAFNTAAGQSLRLRADALRRLAGDVLSCVNAEAGGCGRTRKCRGCEVRCAVNSAAAGLAVERRRARMELIIDGVLTEVHLLVTAKPLQVGLRSHILLIAENVTDLVALEELLPVMGRCPLITADPRLGPIAARQLAARGLPGGDPGGNAGEGCECCVARQDPPAGR